MLYLADYTSRLRARIRIDLSRPGSRKISELYRARARQLRALVRNPRGASLTSSRLGRESFLFLSSPLSRVSRALLLSPTVLALSPIFPDLFNLDAKAISRAVIACQPHCARL